MHLYSGYGNTFSSEVPLPELRPGAGEPDVFITLGPVPAAAAQAVEVGARFSAGPGEYVLEAEGVGRYRVSEGRNITIDLQDNADSSAVRLHLLATAIGILAHQQGRLPFHGGAIEVGGRAVVFAGPSSVGKSTLMAALQRRGFRVLCDDIAVVSLDARGQPVVHPGSVRLKLWRDAMVRANLDPSNYTRVRPELDRYSVTVENRFCDICLPLDRLYLLGKISAAGPATVGVTKLEAFDVINRSTFRPRAARAMGAAPKQLELSTAIVRSARVAKTSRSSEPNGTDDLAKMLEQEFA